jgi:hypothetical protein
MIGCRVDTPRIATAVSGGGGEEKKTGIKKYGKISREVKG